MSRATHWTLGVLSSALARLDLARAVAAVNAMKSSPVYAAST